MVLSERYTVYWSKLQAAYTSTYQYSVGPNIADIWLGSVLVFYAVLGCWDPSYGVIVLGETNWFLGVNCEISNSLCFAILC